MSFSSTVLILESFELFDKQNFESDAWLLLSALVDSIKIYFKIKILNIISSVFIVCWKTALSRLSRYVIIKWPKHLRYSATESVRIKSAILVWVEIFLLDDESFLWYWWHLPWLFCWFFVLVMNLFVDVFKDFSMEFLDVYPLFISYFNREIASCFGSSFPYGFEEV